LVVGHETGVGLFPAFAVACALLALAGVAKVRTPQPARDALALIGLRVPAVAIRALGLAEIALGAFAAFRPGPIGAALVAFAYAAFAVTAMLLLRADRGANCGCFGQASSTASLAHVALNVAAGGVGIAAVFAPPPALQWVVTRSPLVAVAVVAGTAAAAFAAYAAFTLFVPAWRAFGSGGSA
jgi:hypothetical protein